MIVIGVQYTKRTQRKHVEFDEVRKFPVLGDPTKCFHQNQRDYTLQTTTPQVIEKLRTSSLGHLSPLEQQEIQFLQTEDERKTLETLVPRDKQQLLAFSQSPN